MNSCVLQPSYRLAIRTKGMIEDLVKNLKSPNAELQMHCASAIFKVQIWCLSAALGRAASARVMLLSLSSSQPDFCSLFQAATVNSV